MYGGAVRAQDEEAPENDEVVQEALKILRRIKVTSVSKLARYTRKPKGFLGTSTYYMSEGFKLLFMNSPNPTGLLTSTSTGSLSGPLAKAVSLLQSVADENNADAIFLLAEMNFYGNFTHPINYETAFNAYERLADLTGNSSAQYMLGFMYATGLNPAVPSDQAKSMLYHTFAAEQGNTRSEMTLAYRYHAGIATPRNCDEAVHWYRRVADKAVRYYTSGPPGGHVLVRDAYNLADEDGGVYGEGASVSSAGVMAKQGGPTSDAYASIDDVLEYLHMQSSKGDLKATFGLARLYYDGQRGMKRDLKMAKKYFLAIARLYWSESGKVTKEASPSVERLATKAAGYLGRMFLRGEGMEQSYNKARIWFKRGLENSDGLSQYGLGLMYLEGLGVEKDILKAGDYLSAAADQDLAVAQTELGCLFLDQGDIRTASQYFELASRHGHIRAFFYLAEMDNFSIGRERSCGVAANFYKVVAEKAEPVWASLIEANEAYEEGDVQAALVRYLMAAEQGSENSQANVAFLLDQSKPRWSPLSWLSSVSQSTKSTFGSATLALVYWTRSAQQQNFDSLVKMGDSYLSGLGTILSAEKAAVCYQAAAESLQSAQAMWNLGWMHENGIGIEQDFHLAKRFYDQALDTNSQEAYLPVKLSLWKLRWRSWWNSVTKGGVHGIEDEETPRKRRTFSEWFNDFLEADAQYYQDHYEPDDWDAQHDHTHQPTADGEEIWTDEDFEADILDLLLIGGLIAVLCWLIYYRQQQQRAAEQRRRQAQAQGGGAQGQQQQPAQQQPPLPGQQRDGGFFPPPGDPNWNAWVAGGIGH